MTRKKQTSFEEELSLTPLECEVITLKAVLDMISDMVNNRNMTISHNAEHGSEIRFNSSAEKKLFNILLVDFLGMPKGFFKDCKGYIDRLESICESPQMNPQYITSLCEALIDFKNWLSQTVTIEKRWFPSIDLEVDLKIERQAFITMCGNMSKHNFTQQTHQAKKLQKIFQGNAQKVSIDQCLIALEAFYEQFYEDIFTYHSSTIAEFLNNIRWGIYTYASSERSRCVENWYDEDLRLPKYKYHYPDAIKSKLGQTYYWDLMNDVRSPPYIQKFTVTKYLKMHY